MIPSGKRLIVVLGMHRSGSSTITRALNVLGVALGDRLMPPAGDNNAKGFFEDIDLNALNIEMLQALGSDWHCLAPIEPSDIESLHQKGFFLRAVVLLRQKTADVSIFGFKDPRVVKLLPFWHQVFAHCGFDTGYVLAIRNPLSVVQSLAKRDGLSPEKSYTLWLGHVLTSLSHTEKYRRALVDYDHFLHAPQQDLGLIAERLALQIDPQALQHYQAEFLDEGLRHTVYAANDLAIDQACPPLVQELYTTLIDVSRDNQQLDDPAFHARTALWNDEFNRFKLNLRWIDNLSAQIASLNQSMSVHDGEITDLIRTVLEQDQNVFQKSFNPKQYLKKYPDVAAAGIDPYLHYISQGVYEGRLPSADLAYIRDALLNRLRELNAQLNQAKLLTEAQQLQLAEREQAHLAQLALAQHELEAHLLKLAEREKTYSQQLQEIQQAHLAQLALAQQKLETHLLKLAEREQALNAQLHAKQDELQSLTNRWAETDKAQTQVLNQLHRELDAMRATYSWRLTAPLRSLAALLGKKDSGSFKPTPSMVNAEPTSDQFSAAAATLDELLSHHDERFIQCAYHTLLGRAPDPEGMRYYLARVRAGISKIEILAQLRSGAEGKSRPINIVGLDDAIKRHKWLRMPLLGALLRLAGVRELGNNQPSHFDADWYLEQYPDVAASGMDPLEHYLKFGSAEGRLPSGSRFNGNPNSYTIVPYYIDPQLDTVAVAVSAKASIAIHLHLYYVEMLNDFVSYLNNIPVHYDLYVSVPEASDPAAINAELKTGLCKVKSVVVEPVPNRGRDIAPFIVQFGKRLAGYEIVAHIHTKKSPHNSKLADWCQDILVKLMGYPGSSGGRVAHIIGLLQTTAKIVFPEGHNELIKDRSGWADNYDLAKYLLEKYTQHLIHDFPVVEFPEGSMFWARAECLRDLLGLPLNYSDFPSEPIAADATLAHALERLILIFASKHQGQCIRIHNGDSIQDYRHYEDQQKYSSSIIHSDIKVLSYYLPQFHPIPENDLWHGKGFTEWTKVRAANPLFEGHYQQHIPHSDIGYYLLDSPDVLRDQAELMRQSGVHGQVFYHYWFSGKLILEEPAKLLLDNPDIQMPFCFCWANENWTRRWDGNENEILLSQNYSAQDAHDFIHYLIPFFSDSRYIKVEDRPVLFVYRPSSMPNSQEYLDIWERECASAGIKPPYVVAVLTRGATNPKDFGMDAGVERVLHDWTGGAVPEIKNSLHGYWPINGSVLSYDEVANFYMGQTEAKDFTYFRSTVPIWDNTARYGSEAYVLHGSTPQRFQEWMESTIAYTQSTLPPDRRFVLVNAWNEWAESAHLEPDSRYGYSYLNSVGRALSGVPYSGDLNLSCVIPVGTKIHLSIPKLVLDQLKNDRDLKLRFIYCLSRSSVFNTCSVSINTPDLMDDMSIEVRSDSDHADFVLEFRKVAFFDSSVIEKMLQTACASGSAVIANSYDGDSPLIEMTKNGSVHSFVAYTAPLVLVPKTAAKSGYKNFRMRTDARCFVVCPSLQPNIKKPLVTTIIRFHKSADLDELKNALYCLYAMKDCVVIPLIAAQDLSKQQIEALENALNDFAWAQGCEPQVHLYQSQDGKGDLRSEMLNESLKKVKTRYAAFLDFDDLLMSHAYSWLINRLENTGKAVSFGRVYSTSYDSATGLLTGRKRVYEYGYSYEDFVHLNHAPLHSFMLDMERLDLSHIVYFEGQRYMEDYLLTLQLFTKDNGDWDSLKENFFMGDYIHSVDRTHTLAFSDEQERQAILANSEYISCEQRICDMRNSLGTRVGS